MVIVLCYIFTAKWTTFFTQTNHFVLCYLKYICQILISSQSNIRWLVKKLEMNKFVFKLRHNLEIHNAEIPV